MALVASESSQLLQMMDSNTQGFSLSPQMPDDINFMGGDAMIGGFMDPDHKACFADLPHSLVQQKIFMLGNSKELFRLRQICTEWSDLIKVIWCQVVKDEMLE